MQSRRNFLSALIGVLALPLVPPALFVEAVPKAVAFRDQVTRWRNYTFRYVPMDGENLLKELRGATKRLAMIDPVAFDV